MNYNLEIDKIIKEIKSKKIKTVCIQLPDGLKPSAKEIQDKIEKKTNVTVVIWAGSCYGACDIPLELDKQGIDLLIQWGHSEWK
jgi:2-(3-amino-3-carboxypropyl)histidine synthase